MSIVAIARSGDGYRFRWSKHSYEPALDVTCDWDGRCEERLFGKLTATYEFATTIDPATGRLLVACDERRVEPETLEADLEMFAPSFDEPVGEAHEQVAGRPCDRHCQDSRQRNYGEIQFQNPVGRRGDRGLRDADGDVERV